MFYNARIIFIIISIINLAACTSYAPQDNNSYQGSYRYDVQEYYSANQNYPMYYQDNYNYQAETKRQVVVPETYHVGAYHSPKSHKDLDRQWVQSQNPQGYTIEIADGEKASQVAGKLQKAPKQDRRAAIKYEREGKSYYKGVYGTYNSYIEAQEALSSLPPEVKEGANVKPWGNVQQIVNE